MRSRPERVRPWTDYALFVVLVGPSLILFGLFGFRPLLDTIRLSFTDRNLAEPVAHYIGVENYREWWGRGDSWQILTNTVVFALAAVGGSLLLGLGLALLLNRKLFGRSVVRSVAVAPVVISGAAVGVAFQFLFDPTFGLIQDVLHRLGVSNVPDFYQNSHWALGMVTATHVWKNLGYTFVIYLAALRGIRRELLEAAAIDGAGRWATLTRVLLPQLRPTTLFLSITVLLNSLQVFDLIHVLTRGGPLGTGTTTLTYQVYLESFRNSRAGYGAVVATVLFVALLVVALVQIWAMDRGER
ncbi:carbohydrate ABC transporter permease [Nocardia wallacei]|uniref:sn-glycerol-3-phosphate ABC transporter permease UgpA n=3 Tax=Nocardia wallacei TaxID=480035 RepID=A0A7G1KVP4_9NOCA|nr:sugar ABC transporter permease [Nocardia wallacei]BCK59355.1 sn-glycerol-3-phosphate ABC transporter permease UgpA [Nocardia wallacei]